MYTVYIVCIVYTVTLYTVYTSTYSGVDIYSRSTPEAHVGVRCAVCDKRYVTCGYSLSSAGATRVCVFHPEVALIDDIRSVYMICPECGVIPVEDIAIDRNQWRVLSNQTRGGIPLVGCEEVRIYTHTNTYIYIYIYIILFVYITSRIHILLNNNY